MIIFVNFYDKNFQLNERKNSFHMEMMAKRIKANIKPFLIRNFKNKIVNLWMWWYMPLTLTLMSQRQVDHREFEASLFCIMNSWPA